MKPKKKFSYLFYNIITYAGVLLSLVVATVEVFLFALDFFNKGKNLYLGLITYLILPAFLFFGLCLIPIGVLWKQSRLKRGLPTFELRRFRIDLSLSHHRNALLVFIVGTSCLVLMSLVGAYKAFHYTESVQFCGALCHNVMNPEFTAYKNSPHGRVKCVECHIGAGADWYVRSKLSGARQVVKTVSNTFERPIKTPVTSLRPAEETCKQCHWPGKFFGSLDFNRTYFLTDESLPSPWRIRMLLNVGGGDHQSYGVHAHMNVDHDIYYAAEDERRQKITWVKSVDKNGGEHIFVTERSRFKDSPPPDELIRKMDCIDCHNRPTHHFLAPYRLLNDAMQYGQIDASIPKVKEKGLELLSKKFKTQKEALKAIPLDFENFYREKYPDYYAENPGAVRKAGQTIAEMFSKNEFPEMEVRWDTHPDNIGHLVSSGCFRCHDGEHKTPEGGLITKDCKSCHRIVEQGPVGATEKNIDGLEFTHPGGGDEWKEMNCSDCHTGGA